MFKIFFLMLTSLTLVAAITPELTSCFWFDLLLSNQWKPFFLVPCYVR